MTSNDICNIRQLLERVSNDDLEPLVEYILKARTESLSKQVDFKRWHPEHRRYASAILDELRLFGGNSFANLWRKSGPSYTEVVRDVAGKLKVKGVGSMELIELEEAMVQSILRQALEKSSGEDRRELEEILREAGLDKTKMTALLNGSALSGLVVPAVARMILYRTSTVIVNSMAQQLLGHGLRSAVVAGGTFAGGRAVAALAGPVGWAGRLGHSRCLDRRGSGWACLPGHHSLRIAYRHAASQGSCRGSDRFHEWSFRWLS